MYCVVTDFDTKRIYCAVGCLQELAAKSGLALLLVI
jgi:hypothetical protein